MNNFLINRRESVAISLAVLASVLLVSGIVYSSTISTDISTGGTLTASGATSLSSTLGVTGLSTLAGFISTASSSVAANFNVAGPLSASSTLTVSGLSTLGGFLSSASSTVNGNLTVTGTFSPTLTSLAGLILTASSSVAANLSIAGPLSASSTLTVNGLSTLAGGYVSQATSTVVGDFRASNLLTAGTASSTSLLVGSEPNNTVSGIMFGFCTIADISVVVASSTVQTTCAGATSMTASYRVFVQATSSMPRQIVIQSATSSVGAVEIRLYNSTGGIGTPAAEPVSLNYWAIK